MGRVDWTRDTRAARVESTHAVRFLHIAHVLRPTSDGPTDAIQGIFLDNIDLRINLKEALPCDDAGMGKRKIRTAAAAVQRS